MKFRVGRYPVAHEAKLLERGACQRPRRLPSDGRRQCRLHVPAGHRDGQHPQRAGVHLVRGTSPPARGICRVPASRGGPGHRARGWRDPAVQERGDRPPWKWRRRHRPARAGDLRRRHGDPLDRRPRGSPLDRGDAAHVEQRHRHRRGTAGPGQPARSQPLAGVRSPVPGVRRRRQPASCRVCWRHPCTSTRAGSTSPTARASASTSTRTTCAAMPSRREPSTGPASASRDGVRARPQQRVLAARTPPGSAVARGRRDRLAGLGSATRRASTTSIGSGSGAIPRRSTRGWRRHTPRRPTAVACR